MGLNVNMKGMEPKGVGQPWISLEHALNEKLDRNLVIAQTLRSILQGLDLFQQKGLTLFLPDWKRYDLLEGQKVCVNMGAKVICGIAQGIDPQGYLLLELPSGAVEKVSCGDATLLKGRGGGTEPAVV